MTGRVEELKSELQDLENIEDDSDVDDSEAPTRYDITSYGIDFDVEGLVKRFSRGDIFIPPFQRNFVWKLPESSRLIESLLLGLPVPGIFLAQESDSGKFLVIDGQQRLKTLKFFFDEVFNPVEGESRRRIFRLNKVQPQFEGKTLSDLDNRDRINLENSVIHATVVKQDSPDDDDTSIYHIFERLNSGGRKLQPQEIRSAVYHGNFIDRIRDLNKHESWRSIYGRVNDRMKDQELVVRYLAMMASHEFYEPPMREFLNRFVKRNRQATCPNLIRDISHFKQCTDLFLNSIQGRPFRRVTAINVALYESCMVGLTTKINRDGIPSESYVRNKYKELLGNEEFDILISQATGNKPSVLNRMKIAIDIFN